MTDKFPAGSYVHFHADLRNHPPSAYVLGRVEGGPRNGWVRCFWFSSTHQPCEGEFPEVVLTPAGDPTVSPA